jgi:hypothetical protein
LGLGIALALGAAGGAAAAPPELVRVQGTLGALAGAPVADGDYVLRAEIYDAAAGGQLLYAQEQLVPVMGGAYTLLLAPAVPGELAAAFSEAPRFLEVSVVSGPGGPIGETLLRQEVASVPFALNSAAAADDGVPVDAIVLWDASATCPAGYGEVTALRNRVPIGADLGNASGDVANAPGANGGSASFQTNDAGTDAISISGTPSCDGQGCGYLAKRIHRHKLVPAHRTLLFCRKLPPP